MPRRSPVADRSAAASIAVTIPYDRAGIDPERCLTYTNLDSANGFGTFAVSAPGGSSTTATDLVVSFVNQYGFPPAIGG